MVNNQSACDPGSETYLKTGGSHPSGYSAIGRTRALILSELFPNQENAIVLRGKEVKRINGN